MESEGKGGAGGGGCGSREIKLGIYSRVRNNLIELRNFFFPVLPEGN